MTYQEWLFFCKQHATGIAREIGRDAEILLGFVTGRSRAYLIAFSETELRERERATLDALWLRRVAGEPIAYLVGEKEFWSLPLKVSPSTLIPRPDSECLVEITLRHLADNPKTILDLGTGTGAIALAIASERPDCTIVGVDRIEAAVELARQNANRLKLSNVTFILSNWFSALQMEDKFDVIVGNPPYIAIEDPHLQQGDVQFEPHSALIASQQGMADICHLVAHSGNYLKKEGWFALEHGWQQGAKVRACFEEYHWQNVITELDYGGLERVTHARPKQNA